MPSSSAPCTRSLSQSQSMNTLPAIAASSENAPLRTRIAGDDWISLRRIAPSFGGLQGEDARAAYLESIVAAEWIEERTDREARARLMRRLGEGWSIDQALYEAVGVDTDELDRSIRQRLLDEFPTIAGP